MRLCSLPPSVSRTDPSPDPTRRGNYDRLRQYAATPVVDAIKAQRTRKLQGLRLSWKLHRVVEQEIVCARQQEIFKKDEYVGQAVVRFVTEQVRLLSSRLVRERCCLVLREG